MPIVRRSDLPVPARGPLARMPHARMHKSGMLFLSVVGLEALGSRDCQVMVEFDEETKVLKFTAVDKPPRGITEADLFQVRVRTGKKNKRPFGMIYVKGLLRFIGYPPNGESLDFPVAAFDPVNRSISLVLPVERLWSNVSSG